MSAWDGIYKFRTVTSGGGGGGTWGSITGTLSSQTDLQAALDAKATSTSPTFATDATFSFATASTAAIFNGSKKLVSSAVTSTELGYVSGVTSAIQTQMDLKAPLASPTFSGNITTPLTATRLVVLDGSSRLAANASLTANRVVVSTSAGAVATPGEIDDGNSSTAVTIDWSAGPAHKVTLTGNATITLSNPSAGQSYVLRTIGDGTGRTITYSPVPKWGSAGAPTPTGTSAHWDFISLYYDGAAYTAFYRQDFS